MKHEKIWQTTALLLCLMSSTLSAEETVAWGGRLSTTAGNREVKPEAKKQIQKGYNPSSRPVVQGVDIFVTGEPLLLTPIQGGMEFAYLPDGGAAGYLGVPGTPGGSFNIGFASNPTFPVQGTVRTVKGKWDWGFRVGAGYNMVHGGWDVTSNWLRYHTVHSKSNRPNKHGAPIAPMVVPPYGFTLPPTFLLVDDRTRSRWKLNVDLIDLELGREFGVSRWMTLRPFLGPRVAFIPQSIRLNYYGGTYVASFLNDGVMTGGGGGGGNAIEINREPNSVMRVHLRNNFWGAGPRVGLSSVLGLGAHFSLYGDADLTILWGSFHVKTRFDAVAQNGVMTTIANIRNHHETVRPASSLKAGVRYDYVFDHDYALGVFCGYEHMFFWQQSQFMKFNVPLTMSLNPINDDLALNGFHLGATVDF